MTYCLGMLLDAGLIMIADTRTNAGVDDISSFRKLHCLADTEDRVIYAASAGNLSTTQTVISMLREGIPTGVDIEALVGVSRWLEGVLGRRLEGQLYRALSA